MVVAAAVDDRQLAILVESLEADHRRMEAEAVGGFDHVAFGNPDLRPGPVVRRVADGHDGVQAVVAAGQLDDDENPLGMLFDAGALQRLRRRAPPKCGSRTSGSPAPTPMPYNPRARKSRREHGQSIWSSAPRHRSLQPLAPTTDQRLALTLPKLILRRAQHQISSSRSDSSSFSPGRMLTSRACREEIHEEPRSLSVSVTDRKRRTK